MIKRRHHYLLSFYFLQLVCVRVYICTAHVYYSVYAIVDVVVQEQLCRVSSLHGSWDLNSGWQAHPENALPERSGWLQIIF